MFCTATLEDINHYLNDIKTLINENERSLIISTNRTKNIYFMQKYNLKKKDIIQIINSLDTDDFKDKVVNEHIQFLNEVLYIFSKTVDLIDEEGKINTVNIYIKFNLINKKVILISFHEAEYEFKEKK